MGALKDVQAYDLGALVLNAVLVRAKIKPEEVDDVILGQSYQNGEYVNIARMSLLKAGWPDSIPGVTIDRRCCSGLDTVCFAGMMIQSGQAEVVVAGGVESMSNAEFYIPGEIKWGVGGKKGMPRGHGDLGIWGIPLYDRIQRARVMSQPEERYGILPAMMTWAETAAKEENISREACDQWALQSHRRACFPLNRQTDQEIIPVPAVEGKELQFVKKDENPRSDASLHKLAKLKPVLKGVCTAGNSSTENDGAAAVVVTSKDKALQWGVEPMAKIRSFAVAGDDPRRTYRTVPIAVDKALKRAGLTMGQMDLIEIQEAFSAQVLADIKGMGLGLEDYDRINVNGSGISLGHPIACTGTRMLVTLVYEMKRRKARYGLQTICGGRGDRGGV
jgi:acetyl-CoA C-acetyltransferase